jgi:hypothetical protein
MRPELKCRCLSSHVQNKQVADRLTHSACVVAVAWWRAERVVERPFASRRAEGGLLTARVHARRAARLESIRAQPAAEKTGCF